MNITTSRCRLDGADGGSSHECRNTIQKVIRQHHRSFWLVCASVSLLSARHLLVEQNVHFPVQLYINQVAAAAIIVLCLHPWRRRTQEASEPKRRKNTTVQGTLMVAGAQCLVALSMSCAMQAILHFANLPVLVFLTTIAFFAEGLILSIAGSTPHSRVEVVRLSLLLPACAGILIADYRLGVQGLALAIPAMLFAGIASALRKLAFKYYPGDMTESNVGHRWHIGMGILVATIWVVVFREHTITFDMRSLPLLAVNAGFSAAAMLMGGSIFFPMDSQTGGQPSATADVQLHRITRDTLTLLTLIGIVGCYSTLSIRRSYTSWYQLCCFILAIFCIGSTAAYDAVWSTWERRRNTHRRYEIVTNAALLPSNNSEATALFDESTSSQSRTPPTEPRGISCQLFLLSTTIVVLWTTYLLLNFTERVGPRINTALDWGYKPEVPLEVVLSMYKEPVDDVAELISNIKSMPTLSDAVFTIYIKNSEADRDKIKQQTGADSVTLLPNIGREGETYLNHILSQWNNLAKQTLFLQADVHNAREFYPHLKKYFSLNRTGFLSLGWSGGVCDCDSCGDKFFWRDETHLLPAIQSRINNSSACRSVLLSYKGQFVVSAARIRGIDKSIYHDLRQAFVDERSWAHQEHYLRGRKDSMSAPWFGYTMERMWNLVFQCNDMDVAWKCPSLVSGWRIGGDIGDCQCFD